MHDDEQEQTPAEARMSYDTTIAPLNWAERPEPESYYREGFDLLRTIPDRPERVRHVLCSYLPYVSEELKQEIVTFLSLAETMPSQQQTAIERTIHAE